jgi:hypothetical protein
MTPWFNKYTRPHWVGVYETRVDKKEAGGLFNYWNGVDWERLTITPNRYWADLPSKVQHIEWRGFTKEQS